ncbi:MAG: helix-turn-helix transcriptional regulator [Prevotellaceae bacterium]|nr:helix-turn-helix transcriptional regulator [Prevotellaceae bacterium]
MNDRAIADFVKEMRRKFNLTQVDLADKSGVGLRFVRELEQGKQTLRMDKINQVLSLFGRQVGAIEIVEDKDTSNSTQQ